MKTLESLLPKLFITLTPSEEGVKLYAELRKNAKMIKRFEEQTVKSVESLEKKLRQLERESAVSYIALLETEAAQGLLSDCNRMEVADPSHFEKICVDDKWGIYMDKDALFERQRDYKNIGLDFIFSPFSLLYNVYQQSMQKDDGLYLLLGEGFIVGSVVKNGALLYGTLIKMQKPLSLHEENAILDDYVHTMQSIVKDFYEAKADGAMFIEKIHMADALDFDVRLENRLEEELFVEVEKRSVELPHELAVLGEMELT
ncbi:hypothetical protein [Sulfurimonas sp. HSL3-7]|uniref:hypothetical protein n=1 Tax=Sulfonitrofixus jiaomeiensis TaxID=3131938 RepID=UPI0031F744CF